jgi:hypothetical protein
MNRYVASIRIKGQSVKTMVFADSQLHARLILQYQFGMNSLQSAPIQVNEEKSIKPMSPPQARISGLQQQKRNVDIALRSSIRH